MLTRFTVPGIISSTAPNEVSVLAGQNLGRPSKEPNPVARKQARQDALDRNCSEGKFGEGKRRYGLNLIKAKLKETSETVIIMNLIVMNLAHLYRVLFVFFSKSVFHLFKAIFLSNVSRFFNCYGLTY